MGCIPHRILTKRPVGAIAEDLAEIPECTGLMHFNDDPRLVAAFVARDDDHLNAIYASKVAPIAGISRTSVNVVTRLIKYGVDFGEIGVDRHDPLPLLAGEIGLDAVDAAIMETLRTDARLSNREIGRAIGASESNIRKRLARLLAANAIKFSLVCAPAKMGLRVWGQGCIAVRPAVRDQVVEHLLTHHNIHTMYEITGEWGVQFMGVFPSANEFHALIRGVTDLAGHDVDVSARMMLRSQKHNCDYVRIMSDTQQHPVFDAEVQTMTIA